MESGHLVNPVKSSNPLFSIPTFWHLPILEENQTYPAPAFSVEDAAGTLRESTSFGTEKTWLEKKSVNT